MPFLVFGVAIALSAVAAYYSIVGLVTIFAASVIPVAVMGTTLEVAKLVTASWLYNNWNSANRLIKTYFVLAVVTLMLITSMGIFGYLSKAHIQQTAEATQSEAIIERTDDQINQITLRIQELQEAGVVSNEKQNAQIANNEKQIEQITSRYEALIEEQKLQNPILLLDEYIAKGDTKAVQGLVGVKPDGAWGSRTTQAVDAYRERNSGAKDAINKRINELRSKQQEEIQTLVDANARLRSEIGQVKVDTAQIEQLNAQLTELRDKKFELETDFRKLEAEFGPVKYIAELFYGNGDEANLEDAVRTVILMLIFVFDPLAVLLLIAANQGFKERRKEKGNDFQSTVGEVDAVPNERVGTIVSEDYVAPTNGDDRAVESNEVSVDETSTIPNVREKIIKVKDADLEVKYDREKDEFQFVTYPTVDEVDIKDDRFHPEIRERKNVK